MDEQLNKATEVVQVLLKYIFGADPNVTASFGARGIEVIITSDDRETMGMVMGREGRNLDALRRLVRIWGFRNGAVVSVSVPPLQKAAA